MSERVKLNRGILSQPDVPTPEPTANVPQQPPSLAAPTEVRITNPQIQTKFPTNAVPLPSRGLLYDQNTPLSNGLVEMKFMTAREENILTTESYITQGIVIDKFLESMIVSPKFNYDDLLIGDKDALIIASRVYGYGEIYTIELTAPSGRKQKIDVDLTQLQHKQLDESKLTTGQNRFAYSFSNRLGDYTLEFKLLTIGDNRKIEEKLKKFRVAGSADRQITTRLEQMIVSVNGNSDPNFIKLFVENEFMAIDSRRFREYVASLTPGVNMEIEAVDEVTGEPFRGNVTIGSDFFWPDIRL
jgi:hypothetical protein